MAIVATHALCMNSLLVIRWLLHVVSIGPLGWLFGCSSIVPTNSVRIWTILPQAMCPAFLVTYADISVLLSLRCERRYTRTCWYSCLVLPIGAQMDGIRRAGHYLEVLWAERTTSGVRRADSLVHHGLSNPWPGRLLDLLIASSVVFHAAKRKDRSVMLRF